MEFFSTPSSISFGIASLYLAYLLGSALLLRIASRRAGCSSPVKYRHYDPILGLDLLMKKGKAQKSGDSRSVDRLIFKEYGKTVQTNLFGRNYYITMDSENMKTILATEVHKFGNEPMNRDSCHTFLGDGIITTDGALWKRSREFINPIFARAQVSELSSFDSHVQKMIKLIPRDGSTVDLQPLFKKLFLDSSTEFIFGTCANSLEPETSNAMARRLPDAFDEALVGMRTRFMLSPNLRKLLRLLGKDKDYLAVCAEVHSIIDTLIEKEMETRGLEETKNSQLKLESTPYNYVLLKELVKATGTSASDKLFVRNELMNIFFPARDTAAILTGNVIFLLARHPEMWNKVRQQVLALQGQNLTFELLKSIKYLQWVINETLRILAPVDGSWKTCIAPCVLPHGGGHSGQDPILLHPGDMVELCFSGMHMDPAIWGDDALEFRPERWDGKKLSWEYIPFMGGRRICPAQQNVLTDVSFVIVRLMQVFERCENRDKCEKYVEQHVFTKESRNGIQVGLIPVPT